MRTARNGSDLAGSDSDDIDFAAVHDLSSDLVQVSTLTGMIRYVNRRWRETLGYTDDDLARLLALDIVHHDDRQALTELLQSASSSPGGHAFRCRLVARNGQMVPVVGRLDCQFARDEPWLLRVSMHSASGDASADELRQLFQIVFDSPAIGVAIQAPGGNWTHINDALAQMLGDNADTFVESPLHDMIYPDDLDRTVDQLQGLLIGAERRIQVETRLRHRESGFVAVVMTVSAVTDQSGAVIRYIAQVQDISARSEIETQLLYRASHDALTGLPNRAHFMDRLQHALTRLQRDDVQIAVMFLDLDGFKEINDEFGHDQGDRLLVEIGRRLRSCARAGDTVARLGGDEFTILLEQVRHPSIASEVAQRVRGALGFPILLGEQVTSISTSIGIAISMGSDDTAESMLLDADRAMYAAKRAGKDRSIVGVRRQNQVTQFDGTMRDEDTFHRPS